MSVVPGALRHTMREVAHIVGVSLETVWRWALRGVRGRRLKSYMVGGRRYVTPEDLAAFLNHESESVEGDDTIRQQRAIVAGKLLDGHGVSGRPVKKI